MSIGRRINDKNIQLLEEEVLECGTCTGKTALRTFILRDSRPFKLVCVKDCPNCGSVTTDLNDFESLEYGVKITCDFSKLKNEEVMQHLRRMTLINNRTLVTILIDGEPPVNFMNETCDIDSIQGILMKISETLALGCTSTDMEAIQSVHNAVQRVSEGAPFTMTVEDGTGFSRVCPFGVEYTEVQEKALEEFNDEFVQHEKVPRSDTD